MKKSILTLFLLAGLFIISGPAMAADIYVDAAGGSDPTGDGSQTAPYQSMNKVSTVVSAGDTIYCKGVVDEQISLTSAYSGTDSNRTVITAWPGEEVTFRNSVGDQVITLEDGLQYVTISGLNFSTANYYSIYSDGNTSEITISDNYFDGGSTMTGAINLSGATNVEISRNQINDFLNSAISLTYGIDGGLIVNNIIFDIGGSSSPYSAGIIVADSSNVWVINNSLYNIFDDVTDVRGIMLMTDTGDLHDILVENNILQKLNVAISMDWDGYEGITVNYNDYYATETIGSIGELTLATLLDWQTGTGFDINSIDKDPLYNYATPEVIDLHLQSTSPCIDAGINIDGTIDDFDQELRPYNITDMGADESAVLIAPDGLASDPGVKKTTLSWLMDENYPVTGYLVKFGTTDDLSEATPTLTTEAELEMTGLKAAKVYYFSVAAVYETDVTTYISDYSEVYKLFTKPSKVKALKLNSNNKLTWKQQRRVTGYIVKVMNKNRNLIKKYTVTKNRASKKLKVLTTDKTYKIKVRAYRTVDKETLKGKWSDIKRVIL